jgi:choline kinase
MNALIVCAGLARRLRPLTDDLPKALLPINGQPLLDRSVNILRSVGIDEIVVVVGYLRERIQQQLGQGVSYVYNPFYESTNNMASFWFGLQAMGKNPFVYLHGDVIYSRELIKRLISLQMNADAALLVDFGPTDSEAMKVRLDNGRFIEADKGIPLSDAVGEWTGVARFSSAAIEPVMETMENLLSEKRFQDYDTAAFNRMAADHFEFDLVGTDGGPWCEIDTADDLSAARAMFHGDHQQ